MKRTVAVIVSGLLVTGWALAGEHPEHPKAKASTVKEAAPAVGKLDARMFVGEIGKTGEEKGDKDEFVFKHGKFVSTACIAYGFSETPYVAKDRDGAISFIANPMNDDLETMAWRGVVKNGKIKGKAVHQKETGQTEYWFKGTLKTEAGKTSEHPKHSEHPKKTETPK